MYCAPDFHDSIEVVILQLCLAAVSTCESPLLSAQSDESLTLKGYLHQSHVLPEVIFSVERPRLKALLCTSGVIVRG
jgi:hypothetical protein